MKNTKSSLPDIKSKPFNPDRFAKLAKRVAKILKEERQQAIEKKLGEIYLNEDYYSSRLSR